MMVGTSDPFLNIDDDAEWIQTFGGSLDNVFSVVNGKFIKASENAIVTEGVYKDGMSNAIDDNTWRLAAGFQQVQYLVSQQTVLEASLSTGWFGSVSEVRGVGLRMPTMMAGWGRTIDGLPTDPNPQENNRKNDPEHKLDRATWKHGPLDLRWDWRRGMWTGFNDLITDQYNGGLLGTNLFGTNPDNAGGFPFLRGKLEDVFWVRQPLELAGTNGSQQGVKTGEVFTHLNHRWYDDEEKGAAKLSSIFIIPHQNSTDPDCHPKGQEHQLGAELTGEGERIDIKTGAHFFESPGVDGPIAFDGLLSDVDLCCAPINKKYHIGKMFFQDVAPPVCQPGGESVILPQGEPSCEWVPAIAIDECELVGGHFNDLIFNDVELASLNASLCAVVADYTQILRGILNVNFTSVAFDFDDLQDEVEKVINAIVRCFNDELMHVWTRLDVFRDEVQEGFEKLVDAVNAALAVCCDVEFPEIPSISLLSQGSHDYPDPCRVDFDKIVPFYSDFPEIPCDSCPPINLWTPCAATNSVTVTGGCDPTVGQVPIIPDGCQANSKKTNSNTANNGEAGRLNNAGPRFSEIPEPQVFFAGAGFIGVTPEGE